MFISQTKATDLIKVAQSKLQDTYWASIKYDGNYVQVHKVGDKIHFFTSGGKEFTIATLASDLLKALDAFDDVIVECEFIASTDGMFGSRGKCSTAHYRADFKKHKFSDNKQAKLVIFDIIDFKCFSVRKKLMKHIEPVGNVSVASFTEVKFADVEEYAKGIYASGWEGVILKHNSHTFKFDTKHEKIRAKRTSLAIKVKPKPTADLKIIGVLEGRGKYVGMIGSLVLANSEGIEVAVGSGLSDEDRQKPPSFYIGKIAEIKYESFYKTYQQPVFICLREDKDSL